MKYLKILFLILAMASPIAANTTDIVKRAILTPSIDDIHPDYHWAFDNSEWPLFFPGMLCGHDLKPICTFLASRIEVRTVQVGLQQDLEEVVVYIRYPSLIFRMDDYEFGDDEYKELIDGLFELQGLLTEQSLKAEDLEMETELLKVWVEDAKVSFSEPANENEIVIAIDTPYGKFGFVDDNGNLIGFEVELGNAICEAAEMSCTWLIEPWDTIFSGLEEFKYDAIMSSVSIRSDREEKYRFSRPYYTTPSAFFAPNGSTLDPSTPSTFEGKIIGVQSGTLQDEFLTDYYEGTATIMRFQGSHEIFSNMVSGSIDGFFMDYAAAEDPFLLEYGDKFSVVGDLVVSPVKYFGKGVGVVLNKANVDLQTRFNKGLEAVFSSGEYDRIMSRYFSYSIYPAGDW